MNNPEVIFIRDDNTDENVITDPKKTYIRSDIHDKLEERYDIAVDALCEIKATMDGGSHQPIKNIIEGCIAEIQNLNGD